MPIEITGDPKNSRGKVNLGDGVTFEYDREKGTYLLKDSYRGLKVESSPDSVSIDAPEMKLSGTFSDSGYKWLIDDGHKDKPYRRSSKTSSGDVNDKLEKFLMEEPRSVGEIVEFGKYRSVDKARKAAKAVGAKTKGNTSATKYYLPKR